MATEIQTMSKKVNALEQSFTSPIDILKGMQEQQNHQTEMMLLMTRDIAESYSNTSKEVTKLFKNTLESVTKTLSEQAARHVEDLRQVYAERELERQHSFQERCSTEQGLPNSP